MFQRFINQFYRQPQRGPVRWMFVILFFILGFNILLSRTLSLSNIAFGLMMVSFLISFVAESLSIDEIETSGRLRLLAFIISLIAAIPLFINLFRAFASP